LFSSFGRPLASERPRTVSQVAVEKGYPHMLVLSRRLNEKVYFPTINAAIQVLSVRPGVVRLGVEAPPEVTVLRGELHDRATEWGAAPERPRTARTEEGTHKLGQLVRNRLRVGGVGLKVLRRLLREGRLAEAEGTLDRVEEDFEMLRQRLEAEGRPAPAATPARPQRARKALVVEDDRNECELLAAFLRLTGMEVSTAGDGADALDYLRQRGRPDVLLLDMVLPRFDGPSTVRAIRREPAFDGLKIFGMSGRSADQFDLASGPGGVDRWFSKPLNPGTLIEQLNEELESASGRA
jgi:carbon storage regulator CsrA